MLSSTLIRLANPPAGMESLDRRRWAGGITFARSGVRVGVRISEASIWPRIADSLPPDAIPGGPLVDHLFSMIVGEDTPRIHTLYNGPEPIVETDDVEAAVDAVESNVRLQIAMSSEMHLFVHAGVIGWRGGGVVVPGVSRSGKSELVAAMVRAGATYYSDEYAVIDQNGCVHPYARPLALRNADGVSKRHVPPATFGGAVGADALPIRTIVVTRFEAGASWQPRRLSGAESVLALLANTVRARLDPAGALRRVSHIAKGADAFASPRGEAVEAAMLILNVLKEARCRSREPARTI